MGPVSLGVSREEGGTLDGACPPAVRDGARCIARQDDTHLGLLHNRKVVQRIKEVDAMFPIPMHPVMWLNTGFIELPMGLVFQDSVMPLPEHAVVWATNHVTDEQRKKKDDEERKRWSKQRAKLQRGKQRQGLLAEEEEEEEEA